MLELERGGSFFAPRQIRHPYSRFENFARDSRRWNGAHDRLMWGCYARMHFYRVFRVNCAFASELPLYFPNSVLFSLELERLVLVSFGVKQSLKEEIAHARLLRSAVCFWASTYYVQILPTKTSVSPQNAKSIIFLFSSKCAQFLT